METQTETVTVPESVAAPVAKKAVNAPGILKQLKGYKTSLRNDVSASVSSLQDSMKISGIRTTAKDTLGDIAFILLEKILSRATTLSKGYWDRKTLTPVAIKIACETLAPPFISNVAREQWRSIFNGVANVPDWNAKFDAFVAAAEESRKKIGSGKEWQAIAKQSKEARVEMGKRKNDFATKILKLTIRPTLMTGIAKFIVPGGIRVGGFFVGLALSTALTAIFDHLVWCIVDGNARMGGKGNADKNWRLDTQFIYTGIQASEPLKHILNDLLVIGGPLGLLTNTTVVNNKKAKKTHHHVHRKDEDDFVDTEDEESVAEEDYVNEDSDDAEDSSILAEESSDEEEIESEDDVDSEVEEIPTPKKRAAPAPASKKPKKTSGPSKKVEKPASKNPPPAKKHRRY